MPEAPVSRPGRRWSVLERALFVFGLLVLVVSAASAYYTFAYRLRYDVKKPDPSEIQFAHDMQEIPLVDSWQVWLQFAKKRLDTRPTPYHILAQKEVSRLDSWLWAFLVSAILGGVSMAVSLGLRLVR